MSLTLHWRLPTQGDGRELNPEAWNRGERSAPRPHAFAHTGQPLSSQAGYTYYDQLARIARAAELSGFDGIWVPHSADGEETQVVAAGLAREVRRAHFVPGLFTPLLSAVYSAKIANSYQGLSGNRLDWHLVFEEEAARPWHGRHFSIAHQVERSDEFLTLAKGFWDESGPFTWQGRHYEVEAGGFPPALQGRRFPTVYIPDHDAALDLSARHADVHVLPVLPLPALQARIAQVQALAAAQGRTLRFALQADILVRHSDDAAWAELRRQVQAAEAKTVTLQGAPSRPIDVDALVAGPNLWAGFDQLRPGAAHGLVAGYASLVDRLAEVVAAGVDSLVLSAPPHLEEAWRFGEFVVPALRARVAAQAAKDAQRAA